MSTTSTPTTFDQSNLAKSIQNGVIGGLGGGLIFGVIMAVQGMLPMVGMLVRQESAVVGFIVHMLISAFIGATFGVIATRLPVNWGAGLAAGAVYGVIWWVLGALITMPLMLGMTDMVFHIGAMQWMSLLGHIIFGLALGAIYVALSRR